MNDNFLVNGTDRCKCGACGRYFISPASFDAHRKGSPNARRCGSDTEIMAPTQDAPGLVEKVPDVWGFMRHKYEGSS